MKMTAVDYANEVNNDIAANDVSLEGKCALVMLLPDELKKALKKRQTVEIDTEDIKSKYLLSVFWKDNLKAMHK